MAFLRLQMPLGRLNVVTRFHHLSGDSHITHRSEQAHYGHPMHNRALPSLARPSLLHRSTEGPKSSEHPLGNALDVCNATALFSANVHLVWWQTPKTATHIQTLA